MIKINPRTMVIDIETTGLDFYKHRIKRIGMYSYQKNQYMITSNLRDVQDWVNYHDVIIGYNHIDFDIPFLRHCGVKIDYSKKLLDLMKILKTKEPIMKYKFRSFSLKSVLKLLGISEQKDDIDLAVLIAETNTEEEKELIDKYLRQDIVVTKALYERLENEFEMFKSKLPKESVAKYEHLTLSTGRYVQKVICHLTGIKEIYDPKAVGETYKGGYVAASKKKEVRGNIYCLDFSSAFPHAFMMQNLFSPKKNGYNGNEIWQLKESYNNTIMGIIEKCILDLYNERVEYKKKKDKREYTNKILINSMYGITGDPRCVSFYNIDTASDCTHTAQEWIKFARATYTKAGYEVIYSDTDSVFLNDVFNDEKRLLACKDDIINTIKSNVPFPLDTFDMTIDERIKVMFFFTKKSGEEKKKNYIYITQKDELVIKGLAIIKRTVSMLSEQILEELRPQIKENVNIKFPESYIKNKVTEKIKKDITVVQTKFKVKDKHKYKSTSCIHYSIAKELGKGTHILIKNTKLGIGKGVKYCTLQEAKDNLTLADLDLTTIMNELSPFIKSAQKTLW